jgi:hypothetical protein
MAEHQDHYHELAKDEQEQAFLPYHPPRLNADGRPEASSHPPAPTLDDFHGSFNPYDLHSGPYDHLDNTGTVVNYQHAFQPIPYSPQYQPPPFSGAYPSNMHAPTALYNPPFLEQPWMEEIHPSYTPIGVETFEWTSSDSTSYGWLVNTPIANPREQFIYEHTPTIIPVNQYSPLEGTTSNNLIGHFGPETTPRIPLQHAILGRPASVAVKVKNEKLKKDITPLLYEKSDHASHRPLRVSKTKKAERGDNHSVKQEACWRCKRYRKAVSPYSSREYTCANKISALAKMFVKSVQQPDFEFGHQLSAVGEEQWRALWRKSCLVSQSTAYLILKY